MFSRFQLLADLDIYVATQRAEFIRKPFYLMSIRIPNRTNEPHTKLAAFPQAFSRGQLPENAVTRDISPMLFG